jgi:hypothetical protein
MHGPVHQGGEQAGRDALAGHVGDDKNHVTAGVAEDVIVVPADVPCRDTRRRDIHVGSSGKCGRQQQLLHVTREPHLLCQLLPSQEAWKLQRGRHHGRHQRQRCRQRLLQRNL